MNLSSEYKRTLLEFKPKDEIEEIEHKMLLGIAVKMEKAVDLAYQIVK